MEIWNKAYIDEARYIAAAVMKRRGYLWVAAQIHQGKRDGGEVEIAMRALMVARGEAEAKDDITLTTSFGRGR